MGDEVGLGQPELGADVALLLGQHLGRLGRVRVGLGADDDRRLAPRDRRRGDEGIALGDGLAQLVGLLALLVIGELPRIAAAAGVLFVCLEDLGVVLLFV